MPDTWNGINITGLMARRGTPKGPQLKTPEGASQGCSDEELAEAQTEWEKIPHCQVCGLSVQTNEMALWLGETVWHFRCSSMGEKLIRFENRVVILEAQLDAAIIRGFAAGPWRTDDSPFLGDAYYVTEGVDGSLALMRGRHPMVIRDIHIVGPHEYWRQDAVWDMERAGKYESRTDYPWWQVKQWMRDYRSGMGVRDD